MTSENAAGWNVPVNPDSLHEMSYTYMLKSYLDCHSAKHRLLILRDPLSRVISGFLDRFVQQDATSSAVQVALEIAKVNPRVSSYTDVTFADFVSYLTDYANCYLDPHWRPQSDFVYPVDYTHTVFLDRIGELGAVLTDIGVPIHNVPGHATSDKHRMAVARAETVTVGVLKTLFHETQCLPDAPSLAPAWIRQVVSARFKDDYDVIRLLASA
jgi:hypothetical protein